MAMEVDGTRHIVKSAKDLGQGEYAEF